MDVKEQGEDIFTPNIRQAATALLIVLAVTACSDSDADNGVPDSYSYEKMAPAARPADATYRHEAYADCVMKDHGIDNDGYSSHENLHLWLTQRCRFLEPPALGLTAPAEVQECIYDYGPWLRYRISSFPKGYGSRVLMAVETICAPSAPFGQR